MSYKSVPNNRYKLFVVAKPLELLMYVHNPFLKYGKLGCRARRYVFTRYLACSKCCGMFNEHPNGGMTEIESIDVDFLKTIS